jgi:hypothetical protein
MTETPPESNQPTEEEHSESNGPSTDAEQPLDLGDDENQAQMGS